MGRIIPVFLLAHFVLQGPFAHANIVINELFPDPAGADGGKEYVELLNSGPESVNLLGLELQFANGAEQANWLVRWSCQQSIQLAAGERFLVADRNWQGEAVPDVEVYLGLQNGPDAIRLVTGVVVLDLVGYGPLTDQALFEANPVSVVPGKSLARRPDGHDSQNNAVDFAVAEPSPGQVNYLPHDLRLVAINMEPPSAIRPDEPVEFNLTLENYGTETLAMARVSFHVGTTQVVGVLDGNAPGQQRSLLFQCQPSAWGKLPLSLSVPIASAEETMVIPLGYYQVGPGQLVINEILGAPDQGQGEWVELLFTEDNPENLDQYRIRDEGGSWLSLPSMAGENGSLVVLAQDSLSLAAWMEDVQIQGGISGCIGSNGEAPFLMALGQWPSLNNYAPDSRQFADRLYLCDTDGCVVDHVTLGWEIPGMAQEIPAGYSLERIALRGGTPEGSIWSPGLNQSGSTPGCINSVQLAVVFGVDLHLYPPLLDPAHGESVLQIGFEVPPPGSGWDLRLYDLWGQLVRDLGGEMHGPGPRRLFWDGRDDHGSWLPSGAYIVLVRIRTGDGKIQSRGKKLVVFRRPGS